MKDTISVHIADTLIKTYYTGNTFQFIKKSTIKRVKVTQVLCSAALRTLNTLLSHNVAAGMSPKTWKNMFALPVPSSQSQWGWFFFQCCQMFSCCFWIIPVSVFLPVFSDVFCVFVHTLFFRSAELETTRPQWLLQTGLHPEDTCWQIFGTKLTDYQFER